MKVKLNGTELFGVKSSRLGRVDGGAARRGVLRHIKLSLRSQRLVLLVLARTRVLERSRELV